MEPQSTPTKPFIITRTITFGQVDAAGLVFYPRFLEMVSDTIEAWFGQALETPFAALHLRDRLGVPTVAITATFNRPCRLGETLSLDLTVKSIGRSSFDVNVMGSCNGAPHFQAQATLVMVDLETLSARPLPDTLRTAMASYLAPDAPVSTSDPQTAA